MVTVLFSSRTMPPLAISAYDLIFSILFLKACRATIAAVRVVLPWSMCPMVPTFTCGLVRSKTPLAIVPPHAVEQHSGPEPRKPDQGVVKRFVTELLLGLEPRTSSLPMKCSTTELQQRFSC